MYKFDTGDEVVVADKLPSRCPECDLGYNQAMSKFQGKTIKIDQVDPRTDTKAYYILKGARGWYFCEHMLRHKEVSESEIIEKFAIVPAYYLKGSFEMVRACPEFDSEKKAISHIKKHSHEFQNYILVRITPIAKIEAKEEIEVKL